MSNFTGCVDDIYNQCELFSSGLNICKQFEPYMDCYTDFRYNFQTHITEDTKILEIGPYAHPFFRGNNVKYFDVMSADQIKDQIRHETSVIIKNNIASDADLSTVPNIDFIDTRGNLTSINEKFDIVFSSHNLEHQIDLISHFKQIGNLLYDTGRIFLIIPDKRFCFDHYIPESPLSEVIESYYTYKEAHPLRSILAMECETTHNNPILHLNGDHGAIKGKDFECYKQALELYNNAEGGYINTHRWRFTPQQFANIIKGLNELGFLSLEIEKLYLTKKNNVEFYVILKNKQKE